MTPLQFVEVAGPNRAGKSTVALSPSRRIAFLNADEIAKTLKLADAAGDISAGRLFLKQ